MRSPGRGSTGSGRRRSITRSATCIGSARRTLAGRRRGPSRPELLVEIEQRFPEIEPGLIPALERLTEQQRTVVVLVHAYGWGQADVAELLDVVPSTVADHLRRALAHLRSELEATDVHQR